MSVANTPSRVQSTLAVRSLERERNTPFPTESDLETRPLYHGPNYLLRFPSELRVRIFELVYEEQILILLQPSTNEKPTSPYSNYQYLYTKLPKTTARYLNPHRKPPVNHGSAWRVPGGVSLPDWKKSLTGLLLVNKQTYAEAIPHLYRSCEFRLSNVAWTRAFMKAVGRANLGDIRSVDFCLLEMHQFRSDAPKLHVTCARIVKYMPNIENIVLRLDPMVDLEHSLVNPRNMRKPEYEQAILLLGKLKHLKRLVVTKNVFDKQDLEVATNGTAYQEGAGKMFEGVTTKAVRDMILTGDHGILDERRREVVRSGKFRSR